MNLTEKTKNKIIDLQNIYPEKRSALIPALHLAQQEIGYLPSSIQEEVATLFHLDPNEIHAIVTFYDMFYSEPIGKHLIHVCKNISCMLRGADNVLEHICQKLKINPGQTTEDGEFTVIASECLAACDRAPMLLLDEEVKGPVKIEEIDQLLQEAYSYRGHPSPMDREGEDI